MELPGALFKSKLEKIKNVDSQKFLIFEEMELYLYVWKCNFLIFQEETFQAKKKTTLFKCQLEKMKKSSYIFSGESSPYIFGKQNSRKKFLYFRKYNFLMFQELEAQKHLLHFRK